MGGFQRFGSCNPPDLTFDKFGKHRCAHNREKRGEANSNAIVDKKSDRELEQEIVLNVLCRDEMLRKLEEQRVRAIKVKTGEWFFEERAKKFPTEGKGRKGMLFKRKMGQGKEEIMKIKYGRYETAGAKLLKSYQKLSKVSVIPPTPPPFAELTNRMSILELNPGFHKSMENLFLSLTTHIKKISKSQNDVANEKYLLTANYGPDNDPVKDRRSLSDTAIDMSTRMFVTSILSADWHLSIICNCQTRMDVRPFVCLVLSFLFVEPMTPEGRSLSFGQCEVNGVSFRELRDHFGAIKDDVQSQDKRTDMKLLKESVLNVSNSESCCLVRHLLRFYVENIFKNYNAT
ncbi:Synaptotagmin-like protein 3, partial [Ophiophagus hannah]